MILFKRLLRKFKEEGLWWCVRRVPVLIFYSLGGKYEYYTRFVALVSWLVPTLRFMIHRNKADEKRILAIWDFSKDPFTVGDFLTFQELTLILAIKHNVNKVDMIWLYHPDKFRIDGGLNRNNYHYYLSNQLPLVHINQRLGSFMLMDSEDMLASYIAGNHHRYYVIPPYKNDDKTLIHNYWTYFNNIYKFYEDYGYIPHLSCSPSILSWTRILIDKIVDNNIPVVVQLRNAKNTLGRNAKINCWFDFFVNCENKYDVTFIMIGNKNQLDDRFRKLTNVVFSKDYGTTVEQDLALIQSCCLFVGTTSGPANMALFGKVPYIIYNMQLIHTKLSRGKQHPFASPLQKIIWKPETTKMLIDEFEMLISKIDTKEWMKNFNDQLSQDHLVLERINPENCKNAS